MFRAEDRPANAPTVSVVIPAYRAAAYIAEALDSVLAQTFTDYEIIVVNDGSPDTPDLECVLEPYRHRVVYLVQENRGPSAARNTGIRAARAPWIAFLDADDAWEPEFLAAQLSVIRQDPSIDLIYTDTRFVGNSPLVGRTAMELCPSTGEVTFRKLVLCQCTVFLHTTVVRREVVLRAGLFDESFRHAEDAHLWLRIARQGSRIAYQRRVLARYRRSAGSLSADRIAMREGYLRVLDKIRRDLSLTPEETDAVDRQMIRERAGLNLEKARQAFVAGQHSTALDCLKQANLYFRKPVYSLALQLMRLAPGLLHRAYALRRRYLLREKPAS